MIVFRYEKIVAALKRSQMPFKEEVEERSRDGGIETQKSIVISGTVRVLPPYRDSAECISASSQVVLKKMIGFIGDAIKNK